MYSKDKIDPIVLAIMEQSQKPVKAAATKIQLANEELYKKIKARQIQNK